jgi:hypothetical protein
MDHKTRGDPRYFKPEDFGCPPDGEDSPGFAQAKARVAGKLEKQHRRNCRLAPRALAEAQRRGDKQAELSIRFIAANSDFHLRKHGVGRVSETVRQRPRDSRGRVHRRRGSRRSAAPSRDGPGEPADLDEADPHPPSPGTRRAGGFRHLGETR